MGEAEKLQSKYDRLLSRLDDLGSVVVAFSGGVDSTLLLRCAREALGDQVLALTVDTPYLPRRELAEASDLARQIGARHLLVHLPLPPEIDTNPEDRCYLCKKKVFARIQAEAERQEIPNILDGTNHDDLGVHRPGLKALSEMDIISPLAEAGLTKAEIRQLSRKLDLPTWDKPAYSCLLTRLPHGVPVKMETLARIETAENYLINAGFSTVRVRVHDKLARIEIPRGDFETFMAFNQKEDVAEKFRVLGFDFTVLDLRGYLSGSMDPKLS
jgi:pyridinium-3,5-biscarboxylic acid mononucleotide sulfurtransferase